MSTVYIVVNGKRVPVVGAGTPKDLKEVAKALKEKGEKGRK